MGDSVTSKMTIVAPFAGGLLTVCLYLFQGVPAVAAIGVAVAGLMVAVTISLLIHRSLTSFSGAIWLSVIGSELVYASLVCVVMIPDPEARMWLPIALLFAIPNTLPVAIGAAWGIGKIVRARS